MANKDNLIKLVAQKLGPQQLQQMVDQVEQELGQDPDVTPEVLDQMINLFGQVAENPETYASVIQEAINADVLDQGDFPEQFDPVFVAIFLLALQELQARKQQGFARGGLSSMAQKVQAEGRNSDTVLAHISPHEAMFLKRLGGSGTINPQTGLMEFGFFKKLKKAVKKVAKVAVKVAKAAAPMIANAIVPGSGILVGAALGATGGGGLKGALMGGLGGAIGPNGMFQGLPGTIGEYANSAIGNFGGLSNQVLGSGILGGATSALMGKDLLTGALLGGAVANYAPGLVDKYGDALPTGMAQNIASGAQMGANTGGGLKGTLSGGAAGALTNLAMSGLEGMGVVPPSTTATPAEVNPENTMWDSATGTFTAAPDVAYGPNGEYFGQPLDIASNTGGYAPTITDASLLIGPPAAAAAATTAPGALSQVAQAAAPSTGFGFGDIAKIGLIGSLISGKTPQQANDAIMQDPALTAQQKENMLRSLTNYKFSPGMTTFPQQGSTEWDRLMTQINQGIEQTYSKPTLTEEPAMARGGRNARRQPQGALSQMSRMVQGAGDGRSDSIDARLSDGEYVIDAETVALLGNGSTKAGAMMLDQMRQGIRQQKGKALAKGKFSPDAKSPLAYMKGGLR
jgi:hypothetical protein